MGSGAVGTGGNKANMFRDFDPDRPGQRICQASEGCKSFIRQIARLRCSTVEHVRVLLLRLLRGSIFEVVFFQLRE